jgi:plastocyanin
MQYTHRPLSLVAFAFLLAALLLPRVSFAAQYTVNIMDDFYSPANMNVVVNDIITWHNSGSSSHSVVDNGGSFDSGTLLPGQNYTVYTNNAGTINYHDKFRSNMSGALIVATAAAAAAPPPPVVTTNAATVAQLQTQLQALLAQIQALQVGGGSTVATQQGTNVTPYTASCPQIGRTLKLNSTGDDVSRLQQFLALDPAIYPEAKVTGFFGALTQTAVQKWQAKFNIVSSGTPDSTGYGVVGPRTAAAISIICAGGSINGVSGAGGGSQSPVGGFISVTPISGNAPLAVNVAATVNTTNACNGAVYTLNFGDNTPVQQIPVPTGNCNQLQQVFQHSYQFGGSYTVTLSAGTHSTTATVSVTGPAAPSTPTSGGGTPAGTINAFVRSGTAPLSVTFYVSCVAGVAYDVVFGDGQDMGASVGNGKCDGSLQAVTHVYTTTGSFQAQLQVFASQSNGTVVAQAWGTIPITVGGNQSTPSAGTFQTPTLQSSGSNSLAFTLNFDLPSSCTGYDVYWGDNTAHVTQADGGTTCAQTSSTKSLAHTFATGGTYTVVVKRGPSLAREG